MGPSESEATRRHPRFRAPSSAAAQGFRSSTDAAGAKARSNRRLRAPARLFVALALWTATFPALPRAASTPSERLQTTGAPAWVAPVPQRRPGLPNFGVVSAQLYRGAQPDDSGFEELKRLGIAVVVNLRHERGRIARERELVEELGMRYVSIPWRGHDDPNPEQVAQFLRLLRDNPQRKVFVHCRRGAERTGVMVACYRISHERWTAERAQAEMEAFGFRRRFAHLTQFVREFPRLLVQDPVLGPGAGPPLGAVSGCGTMPGLPSPANAGRGIASCESR